MIQRYDIIDSLRLFFAFCVVLIHVPMIGGGAFELIYRCAVPFFYVLSGYFVFSNSNLNIALLYSAKKWFILYIKYFVVISLISVLLHVMLKQDVSINIQNIIYCFVGDGSFHELDVIKISDLECGLYVHWFLIGGGYSFIILFMLRKFLRNNFFYIIFLVLYVVCLLLTIVEVKVFRWLYLSIPYIALGFFIRKNQAVLSMIFLDRLFYIVYVLAFAEWLLFRTYGIHIECYFLTPLVVTHIFLWSLTFKIGDNSKRLVSVVSSLGRNYSMDIYIFHRLIFVILLLLCGRNIIPFAAPLCFLTILGCCMFVDKYAKGRH